MADYQPVVRLSGIDNNRCPAWPGRHGFRWREGATDPRCACMPRGGSCPVPASGRSGKPDIRAMESSFIAMCCPC